LNNSESIAGIGPRVSANESSIADIISDLSGVKDQQVQDREDIEALEDVVQTKAASNHEHSTYATKTELTSGLADKSDTSHTHTPASIGASASNHEHSTYATKTELTSGLADKADTSHTHTPASIGASDSNHEHSNYYVKNGIEESTAAVVSQLTSGQIYAGPSIRTTSVKRIVIAQASIETPDISSYSGIISISIAGIEIAKSLFHVGHKAREETIFFPLLADINTGSTVSVSIQATSAGLQVNSLKLQLF
jgi:hypothetical protein